MEKEIMPQDVMDADIRGDTITKCLGVFRKEYVGNKNRKEKRCTFWFLFF